MTAERQVENKFLNIKVRSLEIQPVFTKWLRNLSNYELAAD